MITVYTIGHGCVQCRATLRYLDDRGIQVTVVDLTDPANAPARDYVTNDLGYTQAPVVVASDHNHWSGFQPRHLDALLTYQEAS